MKKATDIILAYATGEGGMGTYTGRRLSPHTTRLPNLPTVCTSHVAGRKASTSKIGCGRNRNSYGTMRNCKGAGQHKPRNGLGQAKG